MKLMDFSLLQMMKSLMTTTENEIFAHYLFMDNEFFLPTANGIPLRVALSATFTPGIKGGLKFASDMVIVFHVLSSVWKAHSLLYICNPNICCFS